LNSARSLLIYVFKFIKALPYFFIVASEVKLNFYFTRLKSKIFKELVFAYIFSYQNNQQNPLINFLQNLIFNKNEY